MSFLLADIYADVDLRTGQVARTTEKAKLATTDQDRALLLLFVKEAGIEASRKLPQLEQRQRWVTTIDAGCYEIGANVLAPRMCTFDGAELDLVNGDTARNDAEQEASGTPRTYGLIGNQLWIAKAPSTSKELILFYRPAGIIGEADAAHDTDEEVESDVLESVPEFWKRSIVDYVVGKWLVENDEPERAQFFLNDWATWLLEEAVDRKGAKTTSRKARYF